jgi:ADP-ribosyl-[dinitrogen reductase] hydrolase
VLSALAIVDFSSSFELAVITAINLGGDTDTLGAMVGALAGARFGLSAMPSRWLDDLHATGSLIERIEKLVALEPGICRPELLGLELQWDGLFDDRPWA